MQSQHQQQEQSAPRRLDLEEQQKVIALAARLQEEDRERLTPTQMEEAAREVGIEPAYVREALHQLEKEQMQQKAEATARKIVWLSRALAFPGFFSLLSFMAIPTGQLIWLAALSFLPCFLFLMLGLAARAVTDGGNLPGGLQSSKSGVWQFRCPQCGTIAARVHRGPAVSKGKRNLLSCPDCKALRWFIVEPEPEAPSERASA